jgi:hypothetical protein
VIESVFFPALVSSSRSLLILLLIMGRNNPSNFKVRSDGGGRRTVQQSDGEKVTTFSFCAYCAIRRKPEPNVDSYTPTPTLLLLHFFSYTPTPTRSKWDIGGFKGIKMGEEPVVCQKGEGTRISAREKESRGVLGNFWARKTRFVLFFVHYKTFFADFG